MESKKLVSGLKLSTVKRGTCDACYFGRQTASHHHKQLQPRDSKPGERIHSDVCHVGKPDWDKRVCFITFKDESSGYRRVYGLRSKTQVAETIKSFLVDAERETKVKCISFRSDNGTEYVNEEVKSIFMSLGITHELSPPNCKEPNGMAERENRTLCDTARSFLALAGYSGGDSVRQQLWCEAVGYSAYVRNRVPNRNRTDVTPHELWYGIKPDVGHIRVFGCPAFVKVVEGQRKKMDDKSWKGIFVGFYPLSNSIVKVFDGHRVHRVSDVDVKDDNFCSSLFPYSNRIDSIGSEEESDSGSEDEFMSATDVTPVVTDTSGSSESGTVTINKPVDKSVGSDSVEDDLSQDMSELFSSSNPVDPTVAVKKKRGRLLGWKKTDQPQQPPHPMERRKKKQDEDEMYAMAAAAVVDPVTVKEAMDRSDASLWMDAMNDEMDSLLKNQTWILESAPKDRQVVSCRWILKSKLNPDSTLSKRKARLVARGFSQVPGVDFYETFAPVVRYESVRLILSLVAALDMDMLQFDVKTAFLNGSLEEVIYMDQPEGFNDGSGRKCRLLRSLYGLKQAPRNWNNRFGDFLRFSVTRQDEYDGLICAVKKSSLNSFMVALETEFDITCNDPNCYVGMEMKRDRDSKSIKMNQRGYIMRVLERFGLTDARTMKTPLEPNLILTAEKDEIDFGIPYREGIGCLIYLSQISRPDITFAVNRLACILIIANSNSLETCAASNEVSERDSGHQHHLWWI